MTEEETNELLNFLQIAITSTTDSRIRYATMLSDKLKHKELGLKALNWVREELQ